MAWARLAVGHPKPSRGCAQGKAGRAAQGSAGYLGPDRTRVPDPPVQVQVQVPVAAPAPVDHSSYSCAPCLDCLCAAGGGRGMRVDSGFVTRCAP